MSDATAIQAEAEALRELRAHLTVSTATAAAALGVGRERIWAAIEAGTVPSIRLGRKVRVPSAPMLRLLGLHVTAVAGEPEEPEEGS